MVKCQQTDEKACLECKYQEKECQEATLRRATLMKLDEEDHLRMEWWQRECQEVDQKQVSQVATPVAESLTWDKNNNKLDYINDVVQEEMTTAPSSQSLWRCSVRRQHPHLAKTQHKCQVRTWHSC